MDNVYKPLRSQYDRARRRGDPLTDWPTFEDFLDWAISQGYKEGMSSFKAVGEPLSPESVTIRPQADVSKNPFIDLSVRLSYETARADFLYHLLRASPAAIEKLVRDIKEGRFDFEC